jgi:hypothetical protein
MSESHKDFSEVINNTLDLINFYKLSRKVACVARVLCSDI